eukprot:11668521-Alexandrium_andersonii.AAC.1
MMTMMTMVVVVFLNRWARTLGHHRLLCRYAPGAHQEHPRTTPEQPRTAPKTHPSPIARNPGAA